jgi:hypothetical protein
MKAIKSKIMKVVGYVAHIEEMRNTYTIFVRKHERKGNFGNVGVNRRMIVRCMLRK